MKNEIVSVIIPTYKRAEKLSRAIDSVLNQTYKNIEVIVVDDNNQNTKFRLITEKIMDQYKNDSRVKYIKHEVNRNGAAARNTGIVKSNGEFIAFLDDDDWFYTEKIEKQVKYLMRHKDYDGVYCWRIQNGKAIKGKYIGDLSKEILLMEFTPTTSSLLFKKNSMLQIKMFDENFKRHQDFELLLKYFRNGYKLGYIPNVLVEIGQNDGENQIHGKELEETKENFLKNFNDIIVDLDKNKKGFKDEVYSTHYALIFSDYIKRGYLKDAFKIYYLGVSYSFLKFNKIFTKQLKNYFYHKLFIHKKREIKYEEA